MSGGSVLFGLLLIQAAVLLARPGVIELRSRHDRPVSAQIRALRFAAGGAILAGLGVVLFLEAVGWQMSALSAWICSLAAVAILLVLSAAELLARLAEDREGERWRQELGLPVGRRRWQPAAVVLMWTLLVPTAAFVAFVVEFAGQGWRHASGSAGELTDAYVVGGMLVLAVVHTAYHKRRLLIHERRQRERERRSSLARRSD